MITLRLVCKLLEWKGLYLFHIVVIVNRLVVSNPKSIFVATFLKDYRISPSVNFKLANEFWSKTAQCPGLSHSLVLYLMIRTHLLVKDWHLKKFVTVPTLITLIKHRGCNNIKGLIRKILCMSGTNKTYPQLEMVVYSIIRTEYWSITKVLSLMFTRKNTSKANLKSKDALIVLTLTFCGGISENYMFSD